MCSVSHRSEKWVVGWNSPLAKEEDSKRVRLGGGYLIGPNVTGWIIAATVILRSWCGPYIWWTAQ